MNATAPSLYADPPQTAAQPRSALSQIKQPRRLVDLMQDGVYLLFLLRNKYQPGNARTFVEKIDDFLTQFEKSARKVSASAEDVHLAKYAFCAFLDEVILTSDFAIRGEWEANPSQLRHFGEHLAGENFFMKLEEIRAQGAARVQLLEVFHLCLLLGFQGKYLMDGKEKLGFLISRLGDEIKLFKGRVPEFAPHAQIPDEIRNKIRHEIPLWVFWLVLGLFGLGVFVAIDWLLGAQVEHTLGGYAEIIKQVTRPASAVITPQ